MSASSEAENKCNTWFQISSYSRDTGARSSSSVTLHIIMLEKSIPDFSHHQVPATVIPVSICPDFSNSGETTDSDLVPWEADWEDWAVC